MALTDYHLDYLERQDEWQLISDCLAGRKAMIVAGERYVPRLTGHRTADEYANYVARGSWYGALSKTAAAYTGQIFRRDPILVLTPRLESRRMNLDARGDSAYVVTKEATFAVLTKGRYGLLTDIQPAPEERNPLIAGTQGTLRSGYDDTPYLSGYSTEAIRNWRYRVIDGVPRLDQVILQENLEIPSPDGFGSKTQFAIRVLDLDGDGLYRSRLFAATENEGFIEIESIRPRPRLGKPIDYIPFTFIGPRHLRATPEKPPMLEMAEANVSHWRLSVDLRSGLHRTAFPIPWIQGINPEEQHNFLLSETIIWLLPLGASASYLEFHGDGLQSLEREVDRTERAMAKLGAQMLEDTKRVTETAEALNVRSSGETATLADIAKTCSEGFTAALRIAADWVGDNPDRISCEINTDFNAGGISSQDLLALVTAAREGLLTIDDYIFNLQRGEIIRPGRSLEDVKRDLEKQGPLLLGSADPNVLMRQPGGVQPSAKPPKSTVPNANGSNSSNNRPEEDRR